MYAKTYFKSHTYNKECEECFFVFKRYQLMKRWDGKIVCKKCWEEKHERDEIRKYKKSKERID